MGRNIVQGAPRFRTLTCWNNATDRVCQKLIVIFEELETNLMSLVIFITLNICSTCFEH